VTARPAPVDVARVRAEHPITDVVAAAGVELRQRGHGWIGCCPFHDDTTPSLSVDAIPDRFHCFGCGASGDVIDFIQRLRGLTFLDAAAALDGGRVPAATSPVAPVPRLRLVRDTDEFSVTAERAYEINEIAWCHLGTAVAASFACQYLRHERGIDLTALVGENPNQPLVGYASPGWTSLTERLRAEGVTDDELLALDLSRATLSGSIVDTLRGRLVFPITKPDGRIRGFIGRDITGHPAAPKYRNPTHTRVHDKSDTLYRPTHRKLAADGRVVIVEGVLDALALAADAANACISDRIAPVTASGVTVSASQAEQVLALSDNPPCVALDGDQAGRDGTDRWLTALSLDRHRPTFVTLLPEGVDPADWIGRSPDPHSQADRLVPFLAPPDLKEWAPYMTGSPSGAGHGTGSPTTVLPGRDLVRLALDRATDPIRDTLAAITPIAQRLGPGMRHALIEQATAEMTRRGWNPKNAFTAALHRGLESTPGGIPPLRRETTRPPSPELL
jgi:DNA primase